MTDAALGVVERAVHERRSLSPRGACIPHAFSVAERRDVFLHSWEHENQVGVE